MEQELLRGQVEGGTAVLEAGDELAGILAEADRILDDLCPIDAEEYLQQNRQRGGE